jgi:hypothetical protein
MFYFIIYEGFFNGKFLLQTDTNWRKFWYRMVDDPKKTLLGSIIFEIHFGCRKTLPAKRFKLIFDKI